MLTAFLWLEVIIKKTAMYCECQCLWCHETEWLHSKCCHEGLLQLYINAYAYQESRAIASNNAVEKLICIVLVLCLNSAFRAS